MLLTKRHRTMPKRKKITDVNDICRLCLTNAKGLKEIFQNKTTSRVAKKVMACLGIEIAIRDGYPSLICIQCLRDLNNSYKFKRKCEKSDRILKKSNLQMPSSPSFLKEESISQWSNSDNECIRNVELQKTQSNSDLDYLNGIQHFNRDASAPFEEIEEINCPENETQVKRETLVSKQPILPELLKQEFGLLEDVVLKKGLKMKKRLKKGKVKEKTDKCPLCGKMYKSAAFLILHIVKTHNHGNPLDTNSELAIKAGVVNHLHLNQQKVRPFICSVCGQGFSQLGNLARHHRQHTGEKPFQCNVCLKLFAQASNLKIHQTVHGTERDYRCEPCGRAFKRPSHLAEHLKTHSSTREHCCNVCGKGFNKSSHLLTHLRVHSGEKPFSCEHCGKSFNDQSNLAKHLKIHSGERPHICQFCNRSYTQKISLIRHERYHVKLEGYNLKKSDPTAAEHQVDPKDSKYTLTMLTTSPSSIVNHQPNQPEAVS